MAKDENHDIETRKLKNLVGWAWGVMGGHEDRKSERNRSRIKRGNHIAGETDLPREGEIS
jgi:hypothetical protein